ncbi:MAG: hypothetical protein ACJASQ_002339 [Crocinitomicaceae bacterium]|jgi:hypothetical protein
MASYSFILEEFVQDFNSDERQIIILTITNIDSIFVEDSERPFASVYDGILTADNFMMQLSPNKKESHFYFTSDAFAGFAASADISFGVGSLILDEFTGVNLGTAVVPLNSLLASIGAPDGDNAWLATVI